MLEEEVARLLEEEEEARESGEVAEGDDELGDLQGPLSRQLQVHGQTQSSVQAFKRKATVVMLSRGGGGR